MSDKDREQIKEAVRLLFEAKPDSQIGSTWECFYSIKYPRKQYEIIKPFIVGFVKTEYMIGELSFSRDNSLLSCFALHVTTENQSDYLYLCFENKEIFERDMYRLIECFSTLNLVTHRISLKTIQKEIRGER